jgi:demethylmenaquinone methyltransferase/2-methoxy-6-polyprenyl-1,4-benzoquinol methylase
MLDRARQRAQAKGWGNVELVESDVRDYDFPSTVHGVISTFGLEMIPEYDAVIGRISDALEPSGRISAGGLRRPGNWPEWLIRWGEFVSRPFGVNRAYEKVQPWRSVEARMTGVRYEEYLFGAVYLAVGEKPASVR